MRQRRTRLSILGSMLLALVTVACAAQGPQQTSAPATDQARPAEAGRAAGAPPVPAATPAAAQAAAPGKQAPGPDATQRLIVRTATLSLLVADVGEATRRATSLADTLGGFVVTASQREEGGRPAASVQMRVPAERFDEAMAQLRDMAERVQGERVESKDVTEEFVDVDARLRNLRATEQRYLDLLSQARSVEDILRIEQQLSNVRGQIEQLQGRLNFLQRSAELSTITVELRLPAAAQAPAPSDWAIQPIFRNAVAALLATLQLLFGFLIFVAVFAPIWVPVVLLIRWLLRRGRARRAATVAVPAASP